MSNIPKPNWKAAIFARCPSCGKNGAFCGPIKIADNCRKCGAPLKHYETADGPAFFAISIVGTLVGLAAGIFEVVASPPL